MLKYRHLMLAAASILTILPLGCSSQEKPKEEAADAKPLTVEDSVDLTMTATVKSLDHVSRVMTLQDKGGNQHTFVVSDSVQRLNEVMVGDNVNVNSRATLVAELRPPTAEEKAAPIAMVEVAGRSPQGATPAAGAAQAVRVVTTVEAIDVPNMRVTLRGPMGNLEVVTARNPDNIKRLRIGDTIVITYARSVVVSLEKLAAR